MNRLTAIGMSVLLGLAASAHADVPALAGEPRVNPGPDARIAKAFADLQAAAERQDCDGVIAASHTMLDLAPDMPSKGKAMLYAGLASCEQYLKHGDKAYRDVLIATAGPDSLDDAWTTRLQIEFDQKKYDALLATLDLMAAQHPLALAQVDPGFLYFLHKTFDDAGNRELDMRLLKLASTAYVPQDPFADTDGFRVTYARKLVVQNKAAEARPVVNGVVRLEALMDVALDKTLRDLRDRPTDFAALANQQLLDDRSTLAAHPESLGAVLAIARDLKRLGKYQESLTVLESVHAHIADPKVFADQEQYVNWWWNERAYAYYFLGDYPHMLESFRAAITAGERGHPNVSQVNNLAEVQIRFKHYDDALATLAPIADGKDLSAFGKMIYHETHGCAAYWAGKKDLAATDIAYMRAHEKDAPSATFALLNCTGDTDGAVAVLIRALHDPEHRVFVLRELSNYTPDPATTPLWPGDEKWERIKARADVKAAVAEAGGTLTFPFQAGAF